ncbi:MAG: Mut7-C RNAse domain-containing protein [Candidatus Methanoperedens sp.]|nr:Mut7-C RNAse domain-containing protein [Candidatus Methanoperedens sp.]
MRFVTDRMLGKLSRWLRLFGYDTLEIKKQENEDDALLALAEKGGRILVSRDRVLVRKAIKRGIRTYLVQSPEIMEQLREMQGEFGISIEPQLSRCTLCNSVIRKVKPEEMELVRAKDYVYPDRLEEGTDFWLCDNCGQVYWQGKHWGNIMERAERLRKWKMEKRHQ